MLFISNRLVWSVLFAGLLAFSIWTRRRNLVAGLLIVGASVGATDYITYQFLKPYFARPRPCHQSLEFRLVQDGCGGDWGFPSNHAANGAAVTCAVALHFRKRRVTIFAAIVTFLVGLSRIYLGAHFPGDILAGFFVGLVITSLVWFVCRRLLSPKLLGEQI